MLGRLRNYLVTGVLVTAPVVITFWFTWSLIGWVDQRVLPLIPARYNPENYLPIGVPGIGLIIAVLGLTLIGAVTAGLLGRWLIRMSERILTHMPVIRGIYGPLKRVFELVLAEDSTAFREAVMLEFPRAGQWSIGFIAGPTQGEVLALIDEDMLNVFVPTTPNLTSGYLVFVRRRDVVALGMSAQEALTTVLSHGIVTPPARRAREGP